TQSLNFWRMTRLSHKRPARCRSSVTAIRPGLSVRLRTGTGMELVVEVSMGVGAENGSAACGFKRGMSSFDSIDIFKALKCNQYEKSMSLSYGCVKNNRPVLRIRIAKPRLTHGQPAEHRRADAHRSSGG